MSQGLVLLGATGSIGTSTLEVLRHEPPGTVQLRAVTAYRNLEQLLDIAREFHPEMVAIHEDLAAECKLRLKADGIRCEVMGGLEGYLAAATWPGCETVLSAMVGRAGLEPTIQALTLGRKVLLANKESLVVGGELVQKACDEYGGQIVPVDSEHSAIWQLLEGHPTDEVQHLILTASGGPFLHTPADQMARITPAEALKHPTWTMGAKITIDSATLMNKGLEVIEAVRLFHFPVDRVRVVVHPQSIIHSMIELVDGTWLAQLGETDMKHPIHYALHWPERKAQTFSRGFSLIDQPPLTFSSPDRERFPCLDLAITAIRSGGTAPCILNAANEVAVAAFLAGKLDFTGIPREISRALETHPIQPVTTLDALLAVDQEVRRELSSRLGLEGSA